MTATEATTRKKGTILDDSDIAVPVYGENGALSKAERDTLKRELHKGQTARESISEETPGTPIDSQVTIGGVDFTVTSVRIPVKPIAWNPPAEGGGVTVRYTEDGAVEIVGPFDRLVEAFEQSGDLHLRFPREYSSWRHAKARVRNPNDKKFASHGRRGITMSLAWRNSFAAFLKDMGRRPKGTTLERKDNNGAYSKTNCEWATVSDQNANRRGWAKPAKK